MYFKFFKGMTMAGYAIPEIDRYLTYVEMLSQ